MKRLFRAAPDDLVTWLLQGTAEFAGLASVELEQQHFFSDVLCHVSVKGIKALLHVKFQKEQNALMAQRLWEYNIRATMKYRHPTRSFVISLTQDSTVQGPNRWVYPEKEPVHRFFFDVLHLWELPTEELLKAGRPGVVPLLPLTREGRQREMVEEGIQLLAPAGAEPRRELLSLLYSVASLTFERHDQEWLYGRFALLSDILRDTPAFQEMATWASNEGIEQKP
jgi:predicted transposase YdaD